MEIIDEGAFYECAELECVYYGGTADEWASINIGAHNKDLKNATIYYSDKDSNA